MRILKSTIALTIALAISTAFAQDVSVAPPQAQHYSNLQRLATMALNTVPGLGSVLIMNDYLGAGIQLYLSAIGITAIVISEEFRTDACREYRTEQSYYGSSGTTTRCYNTDYGSGPSEYPGLLYVGAGMLAANIAFNIFRSCTYNESAKSGNNIASKFNLSVLPSRRGEVMPYVMYNRSF